MTTSVAVIIPCHNNEKHIEEAVESVLPQLAERDRIIVIDDGSKDGTCRVLQPYVKEAGLLLYSQSNQGPGAARNTGIRKANGTYIAFLDADDILLSDSIKMRKRFLDRNPEVAMVFTDYHLKGPGGNIKPSRLNEKALLLDFFSYAIHTRSRTEAVFNHLFFRDYFKFSPHPICTITVMVRRDVLKRIGLFRTDVRVSEDRDLWLRIAKNYRIGYIDRSLSVYRRRSDSITADKTVYCRDKIKTLVPLLKNPAADRRLIKRHIAETYYFLGKNNLLNRKIGSASRCLFQILCFDPANWRAAASLCRSLCANLIRKGFIKN
jgi:glycosyltransferase involved in cell wall biosynthesis